IVVDWYGANDLANPKNWPVYKKVLIFAVVNYSNMVVYMSSSIYAASQKGMMEEFGVSSTVANLGLALFVLGYGFGPMIMSPLSDVDHIGRNPPYLISSTIFLLLSVLTATVGNVEGLMVLRFLQGFFGSPMLASGGASLGDVCNENVQPLALYTWACSGFAAASIAPILSSFTVPIMGWRWSLWEIVILNAPTLMTPETSRGKILYMRLQRLQKRYPEIHMITAVQAKSPRPTTSGLWNAVVVPVQMHLLDPSITFTSVYSGFVYGIYYSFFEVLPFVYEGIYQLPSDMASLAYLSVVVGVFLIGIPYCGYIYFYALPLSQKGVSIAPEQRLIPALFSSFLVPGGLFLFAWTSRPSIHWMVPTLGIAMTSAGIVIIIQCIFVYLSLSYPLYAASAFGGNSFLRSLIAFAALLWSKPLYHELGVGGGSSLLGGLCIFGVAGIFILYRYGAALRMKSSF
ncbi:uncharacterized protein NECHADRAFT_14339, partial [Fusarium vanettenii 77-13-4]